VWFQLTVKSDWTTSSQAVKGELMLNRWLIVTYGVITDHNTLKMWKA